MIVAYHVERIDSVIWSSGGVGVDEVLKLGISKSGVIM